MSLKMKNQFMKSIFATFMMMVVIFGGNAVFAVGTNAKKINGAKIIVAAHPKTVRITVSKDGFSPSAIKVEKGYEVTLIFTRKDKNSGSKVVFPSLKITKALPVGKEVELKITPEQAGEIIFTSGKFKGTITVK